MAEFVTVLGIRFVHRTGAEAWHKYASVTGDYSLRPVNNLYTNADTDGADGLCWESPEEALADHIVLLKPVNPKRLLNALVNILVDDDRRIA